MNPDMVDPGDDLDELHREIIDVLREGRATPSYLSERTGESRQLVSQRLRDLRLGGFIEKIHKGLYELDEDPFRHPEPESEPRESTHPPAEDSSGVNQLDGALDGWEYGRGSAEIENNREIGRAALKWLRDDAADSARREDVPLERFEELDKQDRDVDSIFRSVIRGAWNHAAERGYVEKPDRFSYRWTGGESDE